MWGLDLPEKVVHPLKICRNEMNGLVKDHHFAGN